eukprot:m.1392094 g.1392094  ORF g.1392094 m.1392094 type:complete len:232 (+) comp24991_c0_seq57:360-1055(+)
MASSFLELSARSLRRSKKKGKAPRLLLVKAPADVDPATMLHGVTLHLSNASSSGHGGEASTQHGMQLRFRTTNFTNDSACAGQPICILPTEPKGDDLVAAARFQHRVTVLRSLVENNDDPAMDVNSSADTNSSDAQVSIPQPEGLDYKFVPFGAHRTNAPSGDAQGARIDAKKQSVKGHKKRDSSAGSSSTKHTFANTTDVDRKSKKRRKSKDSQDSPRASKKKSKKRRSD